MKYLRVPANKTAIENIIIRSNTGAVLYLKDFATVSDGFKEKEFSCELGNFWPEIPEGAREAD
jgi:multidrug efflux pump subunit AcrB